ncbi:MAG: RDD family protein [Gammaproteobacteria bacterium]
MLNDPTSQPIHYGGFWLRLLASLIDTILLLAIIVPLLLVFYGPGYFAVPQINLQTGAIVIPPAASGSQGLLSTLLSWVLPIVAVLIFWRYKSATPGKMILSLIIVDADTLQHPSMTQFVIRYIGYYVSALPFLLGFLWIAFDKRKQGWHDKMANTVVIRKSSSFKE